MVGKKFYLNENYSIITMSILLYKDENIYNFERKHVLSNLRPFFKLWGKKSKNRSLGRFVEKVLFFKGMRKYLYLIILVKKYF